ncbi:unnamed protein product, partial [Prorocentrum cordatum]
PRVRSPGPRLVAPGLTGPGAWPPDSAGTFSRPAGPSLGMESHPPVPGVPDHQPEHAAGAAAASASSPSVSGPASASSAGPPAGAERPPAEVPPAPGAERWLAERLDRLERKVVDLLVFGNRKATAKRAFRESRITSMIAEMDDQDPRGGRGRPRRPRKEGLAELRYFASPGRPPCVQQAVLGGGPPREEAAQGVRPGGSPDQDAGLEAEAGRSRPKLLADVDGEVRALGERGAGLPELRSAAREAAEREKAADEAPAGAKPSDHSLRSSGSPSPVKMFNRADSTKKFHRADSSKDVSEKLRSAEVILTEIEKVDDDEKKRVGMSTFTNNNDKTKAKLMKKATSMMLHEVQYGLVGKVVSSSYFDIGITLVVLLNALLIGAQVQH